MGFGLGRCVCVSMFKFEESLHINVKYVLILSDICWVCSGRHQQYTLPVGLVS